MGVLITEILIAYKYREGTGHITDEPTPWYIWLPWSASFLGICSFWVYLRFKPDHTVIYPGYESSMSLLYKSGNPQKESKPAEIVFKEPEVIAKRVVRPRSP